MEIAVEKLEALIKQAEVSLNNILFEVEMEMAKQTGVQLKLAEVLPCTEELKQEFEDIKKEAEILMETQEDVKCKVDKELDIVCKKIMDLQSRSGCKTENSRAAATVLKSHMADLKVQ